jgi:Stage II sporulation protein E (SpoIIE)
VTVSAFDERSAATMPLDLRAREPLDLPDGGIAPSSRWRRLVVPASVGLVGLLVFGPLAAVLRMARMDDERRLLQQQTDQAGAVLTVAIGQQRAALDALARAAASTDADPALFLGVAGPLVGPAGPFARIALFRPGTTTATASVGDGPLRLDGRPGALAALVAAPASGLRVVDLVDEARTVGYAVADAEQGARVVVYAEQALAADPYVRRRTEGPFDSLDYAIYLGDDDRTASLIGASITDLPIGGTRATASLEFGDQRLLFVTTARGNLGGGLLAALWWVVLLAGAALTAAAAWLLTRLQRGRDRAARLAAENERLFRRERSIAESLQLSLLPQRLTLPAGGRLAARYWPAGEAGLIGGDLFDAFAIDEERWGLVIGDVCGKGVEAAGLTGLVRFTLRSAAHYAGSPAEALRAVHRAMADHEPSTFCTACFVVFTPDADGAGGGELRLALGGHLPPLLVRDGAWCPVGRAGTVLGMVDPDLHDTSLRVAAGDTLVLVTDGLTDARGDEAVSLDELGDLVAGLGAADVDGVADAIGRLKRSRRPHGSADDTAVLVVRFDVDGPS